MTRVAIIGGGAFGTAMACVARRSGDDVALWVREAEVIDAIRRRRENTQFLPGVILPEGIVATRELAEAAAHADFVLMAVPSMHMRRIAGELRAALRPGIPVVTCAKGVERDSAMLMPEVLADMLPEAAIAVLSGPSFAREIANDLPCGVVLACPEWSVGEAIARRLANPRFCVHLSDDIVGTAVAGPMKNVVSIASGIAHARGLGENARATIVTLGLEEATRLGLAKGGKLATFAGLAGAGDFMLTAHSLQSRNTSLGIAIGQGKRAADVLASRKEVTEGASTVAAIAQLAQRIPVEMPIVAAVDSVVNGGAPLEAAIAGLMKALA